MPCVCVCERAMCVCERAVRVCARVPCMRVSVPCVRPPRLGYRVAPGDVEWEHTDVKKWEWEHAGVNPKP
jgi:hypothetical protein